MAASCKFPNYLLRLLDYLIVCIFISPLVIFYWQGTWVLMDVYVLPDSIFDSALISTGLGFVFSHFILTTQGWIVEKLSNYHKIYLQITWKICIYLTSISSISFWRGVWMLMDRFAGVTITGFLVSHGIAFIFLTATRTTSSIVSCPGFVLKDQTTSPSASFNLNAMPLMNCIKSKSVKIFLSHFQTVFFIGTSVVLYWRGTWHICLYLANISVGTGLYTCIATTVLGYLGSWFCFLLSQPLEKTLTARSLQWPYLIKAFLEHVFIYVLAFAVVGVWSGLWCLGDYYFIIPGQKYKHLSALLMHCISFLVLLLAQGSINLVGAPAGCRTHGSNTLEGLFMGTYFIFTESYETGKREEVIAKSNPIQTGTNGKENINTELAEPIINRDSNAIQTKEDVMRDESNATQTEQDVVKTDVIEKKESNTEDENEPMLNVT